MEENNKQAQGESATVTKLPRKGFRTAAKPNKADALKLQVEQMEKVLKTTAQSLQLTQQFLGQFVQKANRTEQDLGMALGAVNDLQYRLAAVTSLANIDGKLIDAKTDELKLVDYNVQALKADEDEGLVPAEVVGEQSTITVTSTTADATKNIFRSRFKLSETGNPEMSALFLGKKVGDTVDSQANGSLHTFTVLTIRDPKPADPVVEVAPVEETK